MVTVEVEKNLSILFSVAPNIRVWSLVEFKLPSRRDEVKWVEQGGSRLTLLPPGTFQSSLDPLPMAIPSHVSQIPGGAWILLPW